MARLTAWSLLRSGTDTPLREVDAFAAQGGLDERDTALVRRLIGTEIRRRGTLRALARRFATGKLDADLAAHVHLGLVQLLFLDRVPDHAAIAETCGAVDRTLGRGKVHKANAILRAVQRARRAGTSGDPRRDLPGREVFFEEPVFRDPAEHPYLWAEDALSVPASLVKRWTQRHGRERAERLARWFLAEPPLSVRCVGSDPEAARAELAELGFDPAPGWREGSLRLAVEATGALVHSEPFLAGRLSVQGESARAAARLLDAREGERVLELCAAPGGKTAVLAEGGARVLAGDASPRRLRTARATLERLRVLERVQLVAMREARALNDSDAWFDAALVDAPCTNTGVLGVRPEARWRFGPASLRALVRLQAELVEAAAARVRPGGRLVVSVCSLEPEEGEQGVRAFVAAHPEWRVVEQHLWLPGEGADEPVDGGQAALLSRDA